MINFEMPERGEIHLFHVRQEGDRKFLSSLEKDRYDGYGSAESARMFLKSRTALRKIAAAYTGKPPMTLELECTDEGKPYFQCTRGLEFNLSHSREDLKVAFSCEPVGFDMENKARRADFHMLAKRYFHADEQAFLETCEGGSARAFLEIWTAKEAMLKLLGKGLADGLEKTRVMNDRAGEFGATPVNLYRLEWEDCLGTLASLSEIRLVRERTY